MNRLKGFVFHELRLKMLALLLAVMLWISTMYMGESKMAFLVPLSFYGLGRSMVIREADTRSVLITVSGPLSTLKNLKPDDIKVSLDLSRAREGRQILSIRKGDVIVPGGLKVEDARPDYAVAEIDKIVEKRLPVIVKLDKRWAGVYEVASVSPVKAEVEGPRELLEKRSFLETLTVDGKFTRQQEVLDIPLNAKSLEARSVRPETVRVVLKKQAR